MGKNDIIKCLTEVAQGSLTPEEAYQELVDLPYKDIGFAKVDFHREIRNGSSEVIYCPGKTIEQIVEIFKTLLTHSKNVMATRASEDIYKAVVAAIPTAKYHKMAKIISVRNEIKSTQGKIGVISAGTADMPVAEEAAITAEIMGSTVERIYDVGVAGIHRLFARREEILSCRVIVVVAGMEGALASVVGGLVSQPVIAVPTSVGYGVNFQGLAPLLSMLNSCASGIGVVNIDNGFGAGVLAHRINLLGEGNEQDCIS